MRTVLIYPNLDKANTTAILKNVIDKLEALGIDALLDSRVSQRFQWGSARFVDLDTAIGSADLLLAIGGDGTIIHASKHALLAQVPILGINAGRMGFLAQLEATELEKGLQRLVSGDYQIAEKTVLEADILNTAGERRTLYALNDVVISKGEWAKLVDIAVQCDGRPVSSYRADGVIVSTPTGSTAYAMSAGGPVVDPMLDCFALTPICPHTLFSRTLLFSPEKRLGVRARFVNDPGDLMVSADGEEAQYIKNGSEIEVKKSAVMARFIDFGDKNFYEVLNDKIIKGGLDR